MFNKRRKADVFLFEVIDVFFLDFEQVVCKYRGIGCFLLCFIWEWSFLF